MFYDAVLALSQHQDNLAYRRHAKAVGHLAVQITNLRLGWEVDCVLRDILTGLSDCSAPARRLRYRCCPSSTLTRLYCGS